MVQDSDLMSLDTETETNSTSNGAQGVTSTPNTGTDSVVEIIPPFNGLTVSAPTNTVPTINTPTDTIPTINTPNEGTSDTPMIDTDALDSTSIYDARSILSRIQPTPDISPEEAERLDRQSREIRENVLNRSISRSVRTDIVERRSRSRVRPPVPSPSDDSKKDT